MDLAIQLTVQGLIIGCGYALIAIGLTMIFGLMNIANFAHGEFYVLGFYFAFTLAKMFTLFESVMVNYFLGFIVGTSATVGLGVVLDRVVFKRLREEPLLTATMATIGLSIFLAYTIQAIWGHWPRQMPAPFGLDPFRWGAVMMPPIRLFVLVVTALNIAVFHVLLRHTRLGKAVRATFQNKESAALVGIEINRVYRWSFAAGTSMAAISGIMLATFQPMDPVSGGYATLKAFIVVILGGMGTFVGAIVAGLGLGVMETLGGGFIASEYKDGFGFLFLILFLLFRPQGIFGEK
ncbi:High-affinity branched-chain amino acid transport system permease protein LivH [Candidatus Entotheonellaceae bacterium PAL068K]